MAQNVDGASEPTNSVPKSRALLPGVNYKAVVSCVFFRLMDIAKEMTREALPIKCLEAVILGMYPYYHEFRVTINHID